MSSKTTVLTMAMQLPRAERAELAKQLLASLDEANGTSEVDVETAWLAEVDRRIDTIDQGTAKYETWDVVRARIAARVRPT